jgi:hypothetical protein
VTEIDRLYEILDRLDVEDNDEARADLIDEAIGLADISDECAKEWRAYR